MVHKLVPRKSLDISPIKKRPVDLKPMVKAKEWRKPTFSAWQKTLLGTIFLALVVLFLLVVLILPEAGVKVKARTEPVTRDLELKVDKSFDTANLRDLTIPGKILEQDVAGTKTIDPSGKKNVGKIASGFVHIYNFSKVILILKAQTTVLSVGDKKYAFTQDISGIRPTALIGLEDQEVDLSSLIPAVPVVAAGPGEQYNLAKGTRLEIENEVFGNQPKALYAVVAEDITGGTTKEVKFVTEGDVISGLEVLREELVAKEREKLGTGQDAKLLDGAFDFQVVEQASAVQPGTETNEFSVAIKMKVRALTFLESDVRALMTERIKRYLPETQVLREDQKTRLGTSFVAVNLNEGQGILNVHFEGTKEYKIDSEELVEKLRGKTMYEIENLLLSRVEIKEAEVKFYPFWVKKAPKFGRKIFVKIEKD